MAAAALRAQLNAHMATMYAEGVVDEEAFEELREDGTAAEVARLFINDAYEILHDTDILMEESEVDFDEVEALTQQLMECTSSCLVSLALVRNEYYIVRNELGTMMQLEEQIAACCPK